jgi:hypothetical protein
MVYVTRLRAKPPNAGWPWGAHCRMFADTVREATDLASVLGLGSTAMLCWEKDFPPYFTLSMSKRNMALGMGAAEASDKVLEEFARRAQAGEWRGNDGRAA